MAGIIDCDIPPSLRSFGDFNATIHLQYLTTRQAIMSSSQLSPTMAEREAELAALQAAFDEYIASSRELEEELDAELAKMRKSTTAALLWRSRRLHLDPSGHFISLQKLCILSSNYPRFITDPIKFIFNFSLLFTEEKLAESSAANAALSMQLENISPQLTSLENSLTESRRQWKEEQRLRRNAEQAQEQAEARLREVEGSVQQLHRENDAIHEELAFKESELEETRMEMEIEKEQLREELEEIRGDLIAKAKQLQNTQQKNGNASTEEESYRTDPTGGDSSGYDDAYAKKLEEELELVTEQLIDTEKRLTGTEDKLRASENMVARLETKQQQMDENTENGSAVNTDYVKALQKENADHLEYRHQLSEDLELTKEKLRMAESDLQAYQDHEGDMQSSTDKIRREHREEVHKLKMQIQELEMEVKTAKSEVNVMERTLQESLQSHSTESYRLKEEVANLNQALNNSKSDYQSLLDELEAVSSRFDEAVQEAEKSGREAAARSLRHEHDQKAQQFKQELQQLSEENEALQAKLDDAEAALGQVKDTQDKNIDNALAQTEMVKKLQQQLVKAKDDLGSKDKGLNETISDLEERLNTADETVSRLEHELNQTKSKLAETESRMIVLQRERGRDSLDAQAVNRKKLDEYQESDEAESRDDISRLHSRSFDSDRLSRSSRARRRARSSSPCSSERMGYRLSHESRRYEELQKEYDALKDQKRMGEARIKRLEEDISALQQQLTSTNGAAGAVTTLSRLSSIGATEHGMDIMVQGEVGRDRLDDIIDSRDTSLMAEELRALNHKCNAQREYNAQLLSKMLSLQGNIQVYCRVRPMTVPEIQRGNKGVVEALSETEVGCYDSRTNKWKSFAFDRVWGADQSQQSIFQDVEPVALSVVDGYNACIFAYGQT